MSPEIPESIRSVLRCDDCNDLLSCGPVLLIHDTSAVICGRCSPLHQQQEEEASTSLKSSRNLQYEALARLHTFPCKFADRGCQVTLEFSPEGPNTHEGDCPFRPLFCPIVGNESCEWIGSCQNLQEHVTTRHPGHLFSNPCSLPRPDIKISYMKNYLVTAFNLFFLIHLKVSATSGKIYHSVRMFGDSKLLDKFSFDLDISGNGLNYVQTGSVLRAGVLALQEPTALCTNINSLLDFLAGNYEQMEFQLTINTSLIFNCLNCLKDNISDIKICSECQRDLVKCKFSANGCLFKDVSKMKCSKHEVLFCKYQTKCVLRDYGVKFVGGSFIKYLNSPKSCRNVIKSKLNSVFRVTNIDSKSYFVVCAINNCENIICQYKLNNSTLYFVFCSSMLFYEVKNLKCLLKITDPQTKHTEIKTLKIVEGAWNDWCTHVNLDNFPYWKILGLDIEINME